MPSSYGRYIHLACSEAMPVMYENAKTLRVRLLCLLAFAVGAVAIGLVLLDHGHCSLSPPADTSAGGVVATAAALGGHDGHGH